MPRAHSRETSSRRLARTEVLIILHNVEQLLVSARASRPIAVWREFVRPASRVRWSPPPRAAFHPASSNVEPSPAPSDLGTSGGTPVGRSPPGTRKKPTFALPLAAEFALRLVILLSSMRSRSILISLRPRPR